MTRREQLKHDEKKLLYEVFLKGAKTTEDVQIGLRDIAMIENGLKLMQIKALLPFGTKGRGRKSMHDAFNTLLDQEIRERYELGLMPLTELRPSQIADLEYEWNFTHIVKTKSGSTKRNFKTRVQAFSDDGARRELTRALSAKGMKLVEIQAVNKIWTHVVTKDGRVLPWYTIDLIEDD